MEYIKNIKLDDVINNYEVSTYVASGDNVLDVMGYTDHSADHTMLVATTAGDILTSFGFTPREAELARIAGYTHDIGNTINRNIHAQTGAIIVFEILTRMKMPPEEIAVIVSAIGHHDEKDGLPISPVSAALIIADKADVRRSRVKNKDFATFDIHDRVNYAVEESDLEIEIDGGINVDNVRDVLAAGVDVVVVGNGIFKSETSDVYAATTEFIKLLEEYR